MGIFFFNWEKNNQICIGNGAEFRTRGIGRKKPDIAIRFLAYCCSTTLCCAVFKHSICVFTEIEFLLFLPMFRNIRMTDASIIHEQDLILHLTSTRLTNNISQALCCAVFKNSIEYVFYLKLFFFFYTFLETFKYLCRHYHTHTGSSLALDLHQADK